MLTVVCVKWGDEFGPEYANRLFHAVGRHLSVPHRFVCITDNPMGVECETLPCRHPGLPGWWQKLALFDGTFADSRWLFFDLDTVIVDDIGFMAEYEGDFACLRGAYNPIRFGSGVMGVAPGFGGQVWTEFVKWPQAAVNFCGDLGDGHWMQLCLGERDRWQDMHPGRFVSYKADCNDGVPEGAAVVYFHGRPRPHEVMAFDWMQEHWR